MKWKSIIIVMATILTGWWVMNLLGNMKTPPKKSQDANQKRLVRVTPVSLNSLRPQIDVHGHIRATESLELVSEVSGISHINESQLLPGTRFKKGTILLRIDDRQARLQLQTLKSDFRNALAIVLPEIKFEFPVAYDRWLAYFEKSNHSEHLPALLETEHTKIDLLLSRFGVTKLFFQIRQQEVRLEKYTILAPFNGLITERYITPGGAVQPGLKLAKVINLESMECVLDVPVGLLDKIDMQQKATLRSSIWKEPIRASIIRTGGEIHEETHTLSIYARPEVSDHNLLLEGIFVQATLPSNPVDQAIEIPLRLLRASEMLFLIENDQLIERRVHIAQKTDYTAIIDGGLEAGDLLVMDVLQGIAPGTPVTPEILTSSETQSEGARVP